MCPDWLSQLRLAQERPGHRKLRRRGGGQAGTDKTREGLPPEAHSYPSFCCTPGPGLQAARLIQPPERRAKPMGSGEGLPEAAAGGPPACTSICIPPSGHGLISASGIYQEMEKKRKSAEPVCVPDRLGFLLASGQHRVLSLVQAHAFLSYL